MRVQHNSIQRTAIVNFNHQRRSICGWPTIARSQLTFAVDRQSTLCPISLCYVQLFVDLVTCSRRVVAGRLAFGNECGMAIIDIVQKTCLLSMGTPDLYGKSYRPTIMFHINTSTHKTSYSRHTCIFYTAHCRAVLCLRAFQPFFDKSSEAPTTFIGLM